MDIFLIVLGAVGGLASILGLGFGIYSVFFRGRSGALEVRVTSRQNHSPQSFGGRAKLRVGEQLVEEATVVNARFVNTSSRVLSASDFERPVTIAADNAKIIDSFITTKEPSDLNIDLIGCGDMLRFTPGILKPGEFVAFQLIADKTGAKLQVTGRTPVPVRLMEESAGEPAMFRQSIAALFGAVISALLGAATFVMLAQAFGDRLLGGK